MSASTPGDAAAAMVELAKGGLSLDEAMTAARGTLQLAAAAQVDAAQAAEIQATALNQFGLEAAEAGHVADVLANTANTAAGSIIDVGYDDARAFGGELIGNGPADAGSGAGDEGDALHVRKPTDRN